MGRHSKKTSLTARRSSLIVLSGLVPAGLVTTATGAGASSGPPLLNHTAAHESMADRPAQVSHTAADAVRAAVATTAVATTAAAPQPQPAATTAPAPTPQLPTSLAAGPLGVPGINLAAYKAAEQSLANQNPGCAMSWTLIAGIGRVESTHANDGKAEANGNLTAPILGPVLDGSLYGNNVIHDTDGGVLDGNASYDRAVGPMQFLPETWKKYGADGNGDGKIDPQNLFDAALTTGKYLCDGGLDMRDLGQQTKSILRYNNSVAYVANVMAWSFAYSTGITPPPEGLPRIH